MFYTFCQNNTGGNFEVDADVDQYVIIEALTSDHANSIAENIGIYFDGCDAGMDCTCCGDRWDRVDENYAQSTPMLYNAPIEELDADEIAHIKIYRLTTNKNAV